jgi:hypothetical protein
MTIPSVPQWILSPWLTLCVVHPSGTTNASGEDIEDLPNEATLQDYEQMPVSQFVVALPRGMGWKRSEPASRNKTRDIVELWLPAARPALLGSTKSLTMEVAGVAARLPARIESLYHSYV